jgi:hypothetical protein
MPSSTSSQTVRPANADRWVQAFIAGKSDLSSLPTDGPGLLRPTRQWLTRWRNLTRPERLRVVTLLGLIGEAADGEQLIAVGEAIHDDPNVTADWREEVLTAIDAAIYEIEDRVADTPAEAPRTGAVTKKGEGG